MGLLRGLYATALASVHIDMRDCCVQLKIIRSGIVIREETKLFRTAPNSLPIEAAYYLNKIKRKYPFTYVATISHSTEQGAIEAVRESDYQRYGINSSDVARIVIGKRWSAFIDYEAIDQERMNFAKAPSLDFLYSPFLLLYQAIRSDIDENKKLFVLLQQACIAMLVMDKNRLYFGIIRPLDPDEMAENQGDSGGELLESPIETAGQLEEIENVEIPEDSQDSQGASEETPASREAEKKMLVDFARMKQVTDVVKNSLNEFYSSDAYDSDFISEVILVDSLDTNDKAIEYLKSTLMLDTSVMSIDICAMIMEIAQRDLAGV